MTKIIKSIKINTEYITLGQFLKYAGVIDNGSYAKIYLAENEIYVNNELENRRGRKLYPDYSIIIDKVEYKIESC